MMQIMGFSHDSAVEMQDWKEMIVRRRIVAWRAPSRVVEEERRDWEAWSRSRPAVKARGPVPERRMARTEGLVEREVIIWAYSTHMLERRGLVDHG
jgi:hypothetical protein